jgi:hypothetical protein
LSNGYEQRREALAKLFAASLMDLRKDPLGTNLPVDLWSQMLPKADATLFLITRSKKAETDLLTHKLS